MMCHTFRLDEVIKPRPASVARAIGARLAEGHTCVLTGSRPCDASAAFVACELAGPVLALDPTGATRSFAPIVRSTDRRVSRAADAVPFVLVVMRAAWPAGDGPGYIVFETEGGGRLYGFGCDPEAMAATMAATAPQSTT
jgi:hypothetical protein